VGKFNAEFGEKVTPQSQIFAPYTDLEDALCANQFNSPNTYLPQTKENHGRTR